MLGYFSLVGLQRVHALVGDYHGALKVSWDYNIRRGRRLVVCVQAYLPITDLCAASPPQMYCTPACCVATAGFLIYLR